jgi:alkylation response protein AidB-like acyl-CoA dehydrogenase
MPNHTWMTDETRAYGGSVARLFREEFEPERERFTEQGLVDRAFWDKAAGLGILGATIPEKFGGSGLGYEFDAVTLIEQGKAGDTGWGFGVHTIAAHYIIHNGTEEQKARWLPEMASGALIGAIAMTEPGTGSDLKAIKTTAVRDGDEYVINGSKTFITNGASAGLIMVVVKTGGKGAGGVSLIMVETATAAGFRVGRKLAKLGMKRNDTAELFFDDMRVPVGNLIGGEEGRGFYQLMKQLPWERLIVGFTALGASECALAITLDYVRERRAFGQRIMDFQNTRFKLAECATKIEVMAAFLDSSLAELNTGTLTPEKAAMVKYWTSDAQCEIVDECLQLFGGYGYMQEYPISGLYADARVQRIYGGTNEIMKEIIARGLDRD